MITESIGHGETRVHTYCLGERRFSTRLISFSTL